MFVHGVSANQASDFVRKEASPRALKYMLEPKSLARKLRRSSGGHRHQDSYPFICDSTEKWLQFGGSSVILYNDTITTDQPDGIIVLGTRFGIRALENGSGHLHLDGEYKRPPPNYRQVYNVGTQYEGKFVNIFSCLIGGKQEQLYTKLFGILKQLADFSNIRHFHLDFETGAVNAVKSVFPGVSIWLCWFHLTQSLLKQAPLKGLDIIGNTTDLLVFDYIYHIAYLKPADIEDAFGEVLDYLETLPAKTAQRYDAFIDYAAQFYIGWQDAQGNERAPRFSPEMWSLNHRLMNDLPITNNCAESYNSELGRYCKRKPSTFQYVRSLKRLWSHRKTMRDQLIAKGKLPAPRTGFTVTECAHNMKDRIMKPRYDGQTWLEYLVQCM